MIERCIYSQNVSVKSGFPFLYDMLPEKIKVKQKAKYSQVKILYYREKSIYHHLHDERMNKQCKAQKKNLPQQFSQIVVALEILLNCV